MADYTFIDLFCGIGGMRLAFEKAGCTCLFSSDWDKYAQQTYAANFGEIPIGNIREIASSDIPDHDILTAGFPCQPLPVSYRVLCLPTGQRKIWHAETGPATS